MPYLNDSCAARCGCGRVNCSRRDNSGYYIKDGVYSSLVLFSVKVSSETALFSFSVKHDRRNYGDDNSVLKAKKPEFINRLNQILTDHFENFLTVDALEYSAKYIPPQDEKRVPFIRYSFEDPKTIHKVINYFFEQRVFSKSECDTLLLQVPSAYIKKGDDALYDYLKKTVDYELEAYRNSVMTRKKGSTTRERQYSLERIVKRIGELDKKPIPDESKYDAKQSGITSKHAQLLKIIEDELSHTHKDHKKNGFWHGLFTNSELGIRLHAVRNKFTNHMRTTYKFESYTLKDSLSTIDKDVSRAEDCIAAKGRVKDPIPAEERIQVLFPRWK